MCHANNLQKRGRKTDKMIPEGNGCLMCGSVFCFYLYPFKSM